MAKPLDNTDAELQKQFKRLDQFDGADEQYKRVEKRVWKRARTKHLRNKGKEELRKENETN